MLTVTNVEVAGLRTAIRGMRNPLKSWDKADSTEVIGPKEVSDEQYEEYAEKAIEFIIALDSTFGVGGIFDPFEDRKITVDVEFLDWDRVTIYRISKDGFFTTLHMELAIYNGTLYRHVSSDDSKKQTVFYCFDDDVSRHMVDAFLSYEII